MHSHSLFLSHTKFPLKSTHTRPIDSRTVLLTHSESLSLSSFLLGFYGYLGIICIKSHVLCLLLLGFIFYSIYFDINLISNQVFYKNCEFLSWINLSLRIEGPKNCCDINVYTDVYVRT